ncbi:MAG: radical SAM protein [Candidatus Hadarchaeales archaeon]
MWLPFRPDSLEVLSDPLARKSLNRYFAVMEDKLPARFQICKRISVKIDLSSDESILLAEHKAAMEKFWKTLSKIDDGKIRLQEMEIPEVSLLELKIELAKRILRKCHFCERRCGVDRTIGERGACGVGEKPKVASEFMHYGEEPELVPSYTIFFSGCTFKCRFCQNWDISQFPDEGTEANPRILARLVENARDNGARNVNWVGGDPTPNLHAILEALWFCKTNIPSVWNSNMYLTTEAMDLLAGTQDIYLTDFKYGNDKCAERLSLVKNYFAVVSRNHKIAAADSELIIRHLVMPNHLECCTYPVLEWIAKNLGHETRVNIMDQYRPEYLAPKFEDINRRITVEEMDKALSYARKFGLKNIIT